jgi:hypothetical protein
MNLLLRFILTSQWTILPNAFALRRTYNEVVAEIGQQFMKIPVLFEAGSILTTATRAGEWEELADIFGQASAAITSKDDPIACLVSQELMDTSRIQGCMSIGPACSIPNWVAIQTALHSHDAAKLIGEWIDDIEG